MSLPSLISSSSSHEASRVITSMGFYSIFILHESGCPFFYRIYDSRGIEIDPAIMGGFFTAIHLFAREMTAGNIETLTTASCRYTFQQLQNGLLILCSAKEVNPVTIERIVKRVSRLLLTKYRRKLRGSCPASTCAPTLGNHIEQIFVETTARIPRKRAQ